MTGSSRPIRALLSARVTGMLAEARALEGIPHQGLRGRFRELLVASLLDPVLPPTCKVMHGTVVDPDGGRYDTRADSVLGSRTKTEDDVVIVDGETVAPVLFSVTDGVIPVDAVLARIEVKSTLTATQLKDAVLGAIQFKSLKLGIRDLAEAASHQCLFAFGSDLAPNGKDEFARLCEAFEFHEASRDVPPFAVLCVVGRGLWIHVTGSGWKACPADQEHSEVLTFLGALVNSLPDLREKRRAARLGTYIVDMSKLADCK